MASEPLSSADAARLTSRVAALSVGVALFLVVVKAWSAMASGSVGILASLADSALDLLGSGIAFFAVRYAAAPPDSEHRFGHGKAEAFAGLVQSALIGVSCLAIGYEGVQHLLHPRPLSAAGEGLAVMAVASALTVFLVWAQGEAIKRTGSVATKGDRMHYASDLAANAAVAVGLLGGGFLGLVWADAAAGIGVALWLAYGAWRVAQDSADHLLDRELPDEDRERIKRLALEGGGIENVHDLRTRASGSYLHVQFHADLDPAISLVDAHDIMVRAEARIRAVYPMADVLIHPDPRDAAEAHGHEDFEEGHRAGG